MDTLVILALLASLGYAVACTVWPYTRCPRCAGSGKRRSPSGKAWRPCRSCSGTGRRVRLGRRIYETLNGSD
jgi:DnaJ-class molecular chaperone